MYRFLIKCLFPEVNKSHRVMVNTRAAKSEVQILNANYNKHKEISQCL